MIRVARLLVTKLRDKYFSCSRVDRFKFFIRKMVNPTE